MRYGAILLLLALLVAAPSADAAGRCTKRGAKTLLDNSEARVFTVKGKGEVKRRYFGCLRGRRPIRLTADVRPKDTEKTQTSTRKYRLTGHWVAWVSTAQSDFGVGEFGRSIEVRSLRRGERPLSQDVTDYGEVNALAVRADGAVAWILAVFDGKYREVDGIAPSVTDPTPLAYARGIDPSALTFGGDSVSWMQDGAARSSQLTPPDPIPVPGATPGPQGLDARFATCGVRNAPAPTRFMSGATRLARTPGGAFVVAGSDSDHFFVSRLSADGVLDPGFGSGGVVTTSVPKPPNAQSAALTGVAVQSDGKVVVSGFVALEDPNDRRSLLVRYNTDGTLDPSFGSGGIVDNALPAGSAGEIDALALAADGRIVVAGLRNDVPSDTDPRREQARFTLARFLANGGPDPTFGSGGIASIDPGFGPSAATSLLVQPDGRVVAAGRAGQQAALVRFTPLGGLDGASYESPPASITISALDRLPDGRIVTVGTATNVNRNQIALARYTADGRPDPAFGKGGFVLDRGGYSAASIAADSEGRLVVAGAATFGLYAGGGGGLIRYSADGSRDTGFGVAGALVGFSSFGLSPGDVILDPGAGTAFVAEDNGGSLAVARMAVDEPALGATAAEPRACTVRVVTKSLTQLLRRGKTARYGKLNLAFERRQPGALSVRAVAKVGGRSRTIGTTTRESNTFGKDIATIRVSKKAWKLLRSARKADIVVTAVGSEGGTPTTGSRTLRR